MKLPVMQCDSGCGRCCGPALCTKFEFHKIKEFIRDNDITPKRQGITCPLYIDGTCSVYAVRPMICKLFGHSEKLVCCNGHNVNIHRDDERKMMRKYTETQGTPDVFIHSLVYDDETFLGILKAESGEVFEKRQEVRNG